MWVARVSGDLAAGVARAAGRPITFATCVLVVIAWAVTGPVFGFSDMGQLVHVLVVLPLHAVLRGSLRTLARRRFGSR
jgi:low affinity Fe/Cu permease